MLLWNKVLWQLVAARNQPQQFIFVAGMQRSGTNMLMDVLERSLETDVYHERDQRAFHNYEMRERSVIHQLKHHSPAPFFAIKALCELDQLSSLMEEFAPAKTLWIVRNVDDVVNSATKSFRNFSAQLGHITRDRNAAGWRGRGMSDETHALIKELYHPQMNEVSAAALMWYFRNVLFFEQDFHRDDRVMALAYERLVTDPVVEFQRIFAFAGLRYSSRITKKIFASSVKRRPAPPIESQVRAVCSALADRFCTLGSSV